MEINISGSIPKVVLLDLLLLAILLVKLILI